MYKAKIDNNLVSSKKIKGNTWCKVDIEGNTIIQYHNTDILKFCKVNNTVEINNGNYFTVSTKARLNEHLNSYDISVYQKDFTWYINVPKTKGLPFVNGMVLSLQ